MHPVLFLLALTLAQAAPTAAPTPSPTANPTATPTAAPTLPTCTPGSYLNVSLCASCPMGRYSNTTGATQCNLCEAGSANNDVGKSTCALCPPGSFSNSSGTVNCTTCTRGYRSPSNGGTICTACLPGTADVFGAGACNNCGSGQFSNTSAMSVCLGCDVGRFSGVGAFSTCAPCAIGTYAGAGSASVCDPCANGTYASATAASVCLNCTTNNGNATFCPSAPTPAPTANPTAAPTRAPTAPPTRAPTRTPTPAPTALECPPGSYSNTTACIVCDPGTFQGNPGPVTACQPCALGRFSTESNFSGATDVDTGDFDCVGCAVGRFAANTGSTTCAACPVGSFNADTHGTACAPCPYGLFARAEGATECLSEGHVPFATERLNQTEITLLAAPGSAITVLPLAVASCPIPVGARVVEMFRASGTFSGIVDVHLRANGTHRFWPRGNDEFVGRDLYTCVSGTWVRSFQYECGDNATAPLGSTEDLWGKGTICHFTEFAVLDTMPATEFCDPVLEGDQPMPRICLKCADPTTFDCGCTTKDTDSLALERPEIRLAIVGIGLLFLARAAALYLRTSLDQNEYVRAAGEYNPLAGGKYRGPLSWVVVVLEFGSLGVLFYLVPVMSNVETDWALHNFTRSEITHMFYATILLGWGAELAHNLWFWFAHTRIGGGILSSLIMCLLNAAAAALFFVSQSALYAPAVEVQTAGGIINSQVSSKGVWDSISGVNQFAIAMLFLELSMHSLTALFEFVTNAGGCSGSTKTGVMRWVFTLRFITLTLAAVAWGLLRARHPCD